MKRATKGAVIPTYEEILAAIKEHPLVLSMQDYIQHGKTTTFEHAEAVAEAVYRMARRWRGMDIEALTRAAFLHDFYLYDWHIPNPVHPHRLHGYHHADRALENAVREFGISRHEQDMIYSHMWPLNFTRFPKTSEAWVLTLCDKMCSLREILRPKR